MKIQKSYGICQSTGGIIAYLLLATALSPGMAQTVPDKDILFYCSFDGESLKPDIQKGEKDYNGTVPAQFTAGVKGKALVTGDKKNAVYPIEGNLNIAHGTVKFWVMPVDWEGTDELFHHFFSVRKEENIQPKDAEARVFGLLIYKYWENPMVFAYGLVESVNDRILKIPMRDVWIPKKWHQVVVTWNEKGAALFVDGDENRLTYVGKAPDALCTNDFVIGGRYFQPNDTLTAIDEFYIFDRALGAGEIKEMYQAELKQVKKTETGK